MQNSGGGVRAEDVILKLKDDGDFDRLRLQIIRKLKHNEELRTNIISLVKQSAALDCPGAENMKPRQLSDAIHEEIGDKLMSQISDGVWNIIRSADGMETEIRETVQSVYDKLSKPHGKDNGESSSPVGSQPIQNKVENIKDANRASEIGGTLSDGELNEPPGFGYLNLQQKKKKTDMNQLSKIGLPPHSMQTIEENKSKNSQSEDLREAEKSDFDAPPGFSCVLKGKKLGDFTDEDPDVPPGFG